MSFPDYFSKYANFNLTRDEQGVLVVRLHTDGGSLVFTGQTHTDFSALLEEIALDFDNKVMVLTGTGDAFMDQIDGPSLGEMYKPAFFNRYSRQEGAKILQRILDVPIPVIAVANGPAIIHSEWLLLADIHIASEKAIYGDFPHPAFGMAGGDGLHIVWEEVAGTARAKWLLWTGETIDAKTALDWGVVSEIVEHAKAVDRGIEIARTLAKKPATYLAIQKETLNINLRRRIVNDLPVGLAYEGLTAADGPYQQQA